MEGPRGDLGAGADRAALVGRAGAARRVLDHDDAARIGDRADVVEVDRHAALVDAMTAGVAGVSRRPHRVAA